MAWTTPKTWAVGDIMTAADMNTYVRDNGTAVNPTPSTTPPASPSNGTRWLYGGTGGGTSYDWLWEFVYDDSDATYPWRFVGGADMVAFSGTDRSTGGTVNFADPTLTVPRTGIYSAGFASQVDGTPNANTSTTWSEWLYDSTAGADASERAVESFNAKGAFAHQKQLVVDNYQQVLTAAHVLLIRATSTNWDHASRWRTMYLRPVKVA